jgi:hypothetical protein
VSAHRPIRVIASANAGIVSYDRAEELPEQTWRDMTDTNLTGAWPAARRTTGLIQVMATPLSRRPEPGGDFPPTVPAQSASDEYALPATRRGMAAQAAAALGILTGV